MEKQKEIINKYIERIKIDYPENDKLAIDLNDFFNELSLSPSADSSEVSEMDIKDFVQKFIDSHNTDGLTFRKSDHETEGYWYTSKDGGSSINVGLFFEYLLEDFMRSKLKSQWISVAERKEIKGGKYLVIDPNYNNEMEIAFYRNYNGLWIRDSGDVIHPSFYISLQDLPKPPIK